MDTRDRIVRSAAKLFLTRSYQAAGITDLCAAAGVRKGSFYHFFPSKAELAKAVIDLHAAELDRRLAEAEKDGPAAGLFAAAEAVAVIQTGFEQRFGRIVGCPFGNLAAELSTTDDALREHVAGVFSRWEAKLAHACRVAAEHGLLRDGIEPDRLAHMVLAQAQGLILLAKVGGRPAEEIVEGLRALLAVSVREDG
ncbi:TetR/AcrR family transcriptional regulator [Amycolatopsis cynarae]|uniref:TetR/AcrR family transcriptional regulator n=1 Tax=Amycolatopsis cynarae TaxID=2995223 RepID=A0ABY7BCW3_9PSEU|nr:TetR/AcrR family transcriptional regulator [Amycolatopsis sp. HUAS 11-8]WAL68468.1 TetR/AcrR family transcriptional regulator [Amycolatopsis sp. HUAS 11-8]